MKRAILLSAAIALFASCAKDNINDGKSVANNEGIKVVLSADEITSIAYDNPRELSEKEIMGIADDFLCASAEKTGTRSLTNNSYKILSKEYLSFNNNAATRGSVGEESKDIPIYEVLVENGSTNPSYLLISADERDADVLGYLPNVPKSESDFYKKKMHPNFMALLAMSKSQLLYDILQIENIRTELRDETIEKVCKELGITIQEYSWDLVKDKIGISTDSGVTRADNSIPAPPSDRQVVYWRRPLIKIAWDQYYPYNKYCPSDYCDYVFPDSPTYMNVPAGCAVIAMAQLESWLCRSVVGECSVNWPYLTANPIIFEAVEGQSDGDELYKVNMAANMVHSIYKEIGAYSSDGPSGYVRATSVSTYSISQYLDKYTTHTEAESFDANDVMNSLNSGKPIYLYGIINYRYLYPTTTAWDTAGHAFLIDGYLAMKKAKTGTTSTTRALVRSYDVYWHVNLGWGQSSSAYFQLDSSANCTIMFEDGFDREFEFKLENQIAYTNISKK